MAISATRRPTFLRRESSSDTSRKSALSAACSSPSTGTAQRKPKPPLQRKPLRGTLQPKRARRKSPPPKRRNNLFSNFPVAPFPLGRHQRRHPTAVRLPDLVKS